MTSEDPGKVFIQRYTVFLHLQAERCFQYMTQKFGKFQMCRVTRFLMKR